MRIIDFGKTDKSLKQFIRDYNADQHQLKSQLRQGPASTAKELIKLYGAALIKAEAIGQLNPGKLPSVRTNNMQLAHLTSASPRTIQRHLHKLLEARIITKKVYHGSNADYELWVNPGILVITLEATTLFNKFSEKNQAKTTAISRFMATKCPHTDAGDLNNNLLIAVDNFKGRQLLAQPAVNSNLVATGRSSLSLTHQKNAGELKAGDTREKRIPASEPPSVAGNDTFPKAGDQFSPGAGSSSAARESGRSASLIFYARLLWTLARNVLYKDRYLSTWQQEMAMEGIVQFYAPVPEPRLAAIHEQYCERITLVQRFVERDPKNRFVQLPHRFFDINNPSGFTGTKKWGLLYRKRKKEVQRELILAAQIRKYQNNLKREASKRKPPLQIFRECETRLSKLGKPKLVDRFYAAVIEPKNSLAVRNSGRRQQLPR